MRSTSVVLQELEKAIEARLESADALGRLLLEFVKGPGIADVLNDILTAGLGERFLAPEDVGSETIILLNNTRFAFHLQIFRERKKMLHSVGSDAVCVFDAQAPLTLDRYRLSREVDFSVFESDVSLTPLDSTLYDGGGVHERKSEFLVHDYHSPQPFVMAKISLRPPHDQLWFFDRDTLKPLYPALAYSELSGHVLLCRMIASLEERRALPLLHELATHPSHVVRWAAIQALGKLDGALGVQYLEKAASDKHPHIRGMASKVLARLAR